MRILYIAYSCSPIHGSEDAIGWNIPVVSAREDMVFVITKEEQRPYIEAYAREYDLKNLHFYYVDIPAVYKKLFRGPFYSGRLNIWHRRAEKLAREICRTEKIDLIHQITPVEFRSVGNYGRIPGAKFVCGPIAGGQRIPRCLMAYMERSRYVEWVREAINWAFRFLFHISGKYKSCACVLFANGETRDFLKNMHITTLGEPARTEVGIQENEICSGPRQDSGKENCCRLLVAGRLVPLKGHRGLLDALKQLPPDLNYQCCIVGEGPEREQLEKKCLEYGLEGRVSFAGMIPYQQMHAEYAHADVLVFPSLREATGTVILEAMAKGLPVVAMNGFGGATILDDSCGWLYDGDSRERYIENLKEILTACIRNPEEVRRRGENARIRAADFTWEKKNEYYHSIYRRVLD